MAIKLAVFDLEGTVFKKSYYLHGGKEHLSAWGALCTDLGAAAEDEDCKNRERFRKGNYLYSEWVLDTIKIYQKYGLSKARFDEVIQSVEYHKGAAEMFTALKDAKIKVAVVSGGLKALADRVAIEHKIEHCFATAELYWCFKGQIMHWNIMPTDFEHKRSVAEMLLKDLSIERECCAFIGDGINDQDVAAYVGTSIAFNSHQDLKKVSHHIIEQNKGEEDLRAILDYLI